MCKILYFILNVCKPAVVPYQMIDQEEEKENELVDGLYPWEHIVWNKVIERQKRNNDIEYIIAANMLKNNFKHSRLDSNV